MLSKILSKSQCAECGFCCVFRRASRWETPLFTEEVKNSLSEKYKNAKFKKVGDMYTVNLDDEYKTKSEDEEAPCFFLDENSGCMLRDEEKPLDCKIWPLRIMKKDNETIIALTPTCKEINKLPLETVRDLVRSGLGEFIKGEAEKMPWIIKEYRENFPELMSFSD